MKNQLTKQNIEDLVALTPMQQGMLFHHLKDVNSREYFEQLSLRLKGTVNISIIKKAWEYVSRCNEMLRTVYRWDKLNAPVQIVLKYHEVPIKYYNIKGISKKEQESYINDINMKDREEGLDISTEPFRITVVELKDDECEMIVTNHHIIYDGWSNGILIKEFIDACNKLNSGKEPSILVKNKYSQYVKWCQNQDKDENEAYWRKYFNRYDSKAVLPVDNYSTQEKTGKINISYSFTEEMTQCIYEFCKNSKVTIASFFYTAWGILLHKYCNTEDIVFGTTVSGRNARIIGIEEIVGLFINTIPLRMNINNIESIGDVLKKVNTGLIERTEYQHTPLIDIKSYGNLDNRDELIDTLVVIENYPLDKLLSSKDNCISIEKYSMVEMNNYKLTLTVIELGEIKLDFSYDPGLFIGDTMKRMVEHFKKIVNTLIYNADDSISQVDILSEKEKNEILVEFNDTMAKCPEEMIMHLLFEEQVEKTPDNIVAIYGDKRFTYKELNDRANQLARTLRDKGVVSDSIVGIMTERNLDMIVGIIGILKAGGAYLPIDPEYPDERIEFMLSDSGTKILLSQAELESKHFNNIEILILNDEKLYKEDTSNLENINTPKDLIYIIYTSGSTGKPKGVMVPHKGVVNYVVWAAKSYVKEEKISFPLYTSISFDLTVTSLYTPLITGNSIVIYGENKHQFTIEKVLEDNKVGIIKLTPAHLRLIKDKDCSRTNIKRLIVGGEQLEVSLAYDIYQNFGGNVEIYNEYGPTEASVGCMIYRYDPQKDIRTVVSIGRPVDNMQIYILDKYSNITVNNAIGELYIGGEGLARGYLNRKELTEERFIDNPFRPNEKIYRTGDLARRLSDGDIEFIGRIDHQVKIRGYRIELGEIEDKLLCHPDIKEATVVAREDKSGKYLCAYIVVNKQYIDNTQLTEQIEIKQDELRKYLLKQLPDYMIPEYFIAIDNLPLTQNGKLDYKMLPGPDESSRIDDKYEAPRSLLEEKLSIIWSEVLGISNIGINADFFELGGHSLKAVNLVARIHKELSIEVPLSEIFKLPTIKELSEYINSIKESEYREIKPVTKLDGYDSEYYEMSSSQKRIYALQQFDTESVSYNIPAIFEIEGTLDKERLEKAFQTLIKRHEMLRTSFEITKDSLVQKINNEVELEIEYLDDFLITEATQMEEQIEAEIKDFVRTFNLSEAPLMRVRLISFKFPNKIENTDAIDIIEKKQRYILMFDIHHIISDGISTNILLEEFTKAYEGKKLPELRLQYKDYAVWQNKFHKSDRIMQQKEYWKGVFSGEIPVLNMPLDYPRPSIQSFEGNTISFEIGKVHKEGLQRITKETGSTLYMVLLAAFNILLSKYSGQEDIVIGCPIAGRTHADMRNIIGMFVNTLAMRNYPAGQKTFREFAREVKENALKAYENQDYQFEELVEALKISRDFNRNPIFDIVFVMQNIDIGQLNMENASIKTYKYKSRISKFDMTFTAVESEDNISLSIEYCTKLFNRTTIERLYKHFESIIQTVINDIDVKLSEIDIITQEEEQMLLHDFNNTQAEYPNDKTLHKLFEDRVEISPESIAVVYEKEKVSYKELNIRANSLARYLRKQGVKDNDIVGILLDRSIDMIVAVLAVLKAGGAYLPIDPEYPQDRIKYTLEDSTAKIALTSRKYKNIAEFNGLELYMDDNRVYEEDCSNLEEVGTPNSLAYVIYTSGTTGKPKGAMIEHRNVVRLMFNNKIKFDFTSKDVWTMFHSLCFDFSVWEMYGALLYGGKLVIVPKSVAQEPKEYLKLLKQENVTVLNQTPTAFYNLSSEELMCKEKELSVRYVIFGGEALKPIMLEKWRKRYAHTKLINMYGITETTVHVTYKEITEYEIEHNISNIGKPIPTLTTYIMDRNMKLLPIGVAGELCVGGDGVCRGYLNRPELTLEKFVQNPYVDGERLYRSGDLVRVLPDGDMEYIGRIDHQVKIRGHRVEIGEIENKLLEYDDVKETVIIAKEDNNSNKYLCAYIVGERKFTASELREYLLKSLPSYMIPAYFIQLDKIPLTSNGKVDRKSLPEPDGNIITGVDYEAPRNEIEQKLVEIWEQVLSIDRIGISDNFFTLGGDSIKALRLISAININLNKKLHIRSIYHFSSIKELASCFEEGQTHIIENEEEIENAKAELEVLKSSILEERELFKKLPDDFEDFYPMSDIEQGMVYHYLKNSGNGVYHDQLLYVMKDEYIDYQALEKAINLMTDKHEILRTSFDLQNFDCSLQIVHKSFTPDIDYIDIKKINKQEQYDFINKYLEEDKRNIFDLSKPLWRIRMFIVDDNSLIFALIFHHAVLDGWSVASFVTEVVNLYYKIREKQGMLSIPTKLNNSYKDYIIEQMAAKKNTELIKYWEEELREYKRVELKQSNHSGTGGIKTLEYNLESEVLNELTALTNKYNTSIKTIFFTAYLYMVNMLSHENDVTIGMVEHNRPICVDGDKLLGCFLNTVPFRLKHEKEMTWQELIKYVDGKMKKLKNYTSLSLFEIIKCASEGSAHDNPLFDTFFNYIDFHIINDLNKKLISYNLNDHEIDLNTRTNTLLDFTIYNTLGNCKVKMIYADDTFTDNEIKKLLQYFKNVLELLIKYSDKVVSKGDVLTLEERQQVLVEFNSVKKSYPKEKTINELFEIKAELMQDKTAVIYDDKQLSYRELNEKANQLARVLRENGIGPNKMVGIMVERSLEMIIGIIGILKAGGAYLPIDPEYPQDRIEYILEDSGAQILLTQSWIAKELQFDKKVLILDNCQLYEMEASNLVRSNKSDDLAYVIYTSGSTGKPKGVAVEHRCIINTLFALQEQYPLLEADSFLLKTTYTFDVSVAELFGWFIGAGKLVMLKNGEEKEVRSIVRSIKKNRITHINFVPSMFNVFIDIIDEVERNQISSLKYVMIAGEAISMELFNKIRSINISSRFENLYGPTEASIYALGYSLRDSDEIKSKNVPIGQPIANTKVYILDKHNNLQPIGVAGELCIGGYGVAREYLNNVELTEERFIKNPFEEKERIYKTGDLARWLPDGNVEFLGRIDFQVKIRGFRIELGEIENQLLKHEAVKEVIVVAKEDSTENKYLCAYITSEKALDIIELKEYLSQVLPDYMIPSYYVQLDKLPLTSNGKIDRKALPEPDGFIKTEVEYEVPRDEIEKKLVDIWSEVLGVDRIGVNDNFFELGGHSLKATSLVARIYKELSVEIPIKEVFRIPTIRDMRKYIKNTNKATYLEIQAIEEKEYYETSSAQKRMYMLQMLNTEGTIYNMPGLVEIGGDINKEIIKDVFKKLIKRHESLRTSFEFKEEGLVQKIHNEIELEIEYKELLNVTNNELHTEIEKAFKSFSRVFDLSKLPLMRVGLVKLPQVMQHKRYILMFDMHHMISDGVSISIMIKEFIEIYQGKELSPLRIQYKDYASWQNDLIKSDRMKKQEEYWLEVFKGEIPVLNMPTDFPRPAVMSFEGESISLEISKDITRKIEKFIKETESTQYMVFLATLNILLSKYCGQEDIVIGNPIAGRQHADLEGVIGMFVNILAMRNYPIGQKIFKEFLAEVKENALRAYENQDYQFEELVNKLGIARTINKNPLFDVALNMSSASFNIMKTEELIFNPYEFKNKISKFDFSFIVENNMDTLQLTLVYNSNLFKNNTAQGLLKHYINLLTEVIENPSLKISEIKIFQEDEREMILNSLIKTKIEEYDEEFDF